MWVKGYYDTSPVLDVPTLNLSKYVLTVEGGTRTGSFTYDYGGDGEISVSSSDTSIATVSLDTETKKVAVTYIKSGSCTITVSASKTKNWANVQKFCAVACKKSSPNLKLSATSLKITPTEKSKTFDVTYDGDGILSVESSNPDVCEVSLSGKTVTCTWKDVGTAKITVKVA